METIGIKDVEIDILAEKNDEWFAGECKWTNKTIGISEYKKLVEKTSKLPFEIKKYIFVSKNGFEENIMNLKDVILVEFGEFDGWDLKNGD